MKEQVRVLQVLSGMDRGGAETMVMNLYRNINRSKLQFDFIVHTEDKCAYDDEIESLGGKIYRIPRYTGKNHWGYERAWHDFFRLHPEHKVIHGHIRSTASIYLKIAKRYNLITFAHSHNTSSGSGLSALVKNIYQYPIRYIADYLLACSTVAGEWLYGKKACKQENFFIVNNAIESKKFLFNIDTRTKKRIEFQIVNKFVVGHVGRFHNQKNHEFLIDIFKTIYEKNDNSVLMLIGEGKLRETIEKKVENLGLSDNVILTGVRSDISELLQAMDVFVFPSLHEGLPVTIVEAQAAGLPAVLSNEITNEVKITELVEYISLEKDKDYWAKEILKHAENKFRNIDTYEEIVSSGYDIENTAQWYQQFVFDTIKDE